MAPSVARLRATYRCVLLKCDELASWVQMEPVRLRPWTEHKVRA